MYIEKAYMAKTCMEFGFVLKLHVLAIKWSLWNQNIKVSPHSEHCSKELCVRNDSSYSSYFICLVIISY